MTIREAVLEVGYARLPAFRPGLDGSEIAAILGTPLALGRCGPVHRIVPIQSEHATPNTYSGRYGLGIFPYHTDLAHHRMPPRFIMLRCVAGFSTVATLLIDGSSLVQSIGPSLLARALVQPRRPVYGMRPLMPIYAPHLGPCGLLRWDESFIQPASGAGKIGCMHLKEELSNIVPIKVALMTPGDTMIVDNWRMLHGRSAVSLACRERILERAYLEDIA